MKIVCVENNYGGCQGNVTWHSLPDTALWREGKPLFLVDDSEGVELVPSVVVRINRLGKCIAPRFAHRYWNEYALGLNARMSGKLAQLAGEGLPWSEACAFDGSALVGPMMPLQEGGPADFTATTSTGESVEWEAEDMKLGIDEVIALVSQRSTLKIGDLLFVALPRKGLKINIGDEVNVKASSGEEYIVRIK